MRLAWLAPLLLLDACGQSAPIDPNLYASVETKIRREFAPAPAPPVIAMWHARARHSASRAERWKLRRVLQLNNPTLRFINLDARTVMLEPHLVASDLTGMQIAAESVAVFDHVWSENCAAYAPFGRRVAGWFTWPAAKDQPDTPLGTPIPSGC